MRLDAGFLFVREMLEDALVVDHDQRAVLDNLALGGEVQRDDRDAFQVDVLPDVQLGPVGQREDAIDSPFFTLPL